MNTKTIPKATIKPCQINMPLPGSIYANEIEGVKNRKAKVLILLTNTFGCK